MYINTCETIIVINLVSLSCPSPPKFFSNFPLPPLIVPCRTLGNHDQSLASLSLSCSLYFQNGTIWYIVPLPSFSLPLFLFDEVSSIMLTRGSSGGSRSPGWIVILRQVQHPGHFQLPLKTPAPAAHMPQSVCVPEGNAFSLSPWQ